MSAKRLAKRRCAFTLVEALISVAILAGMVLMLAVVFRQSSQVARRTRAGAAVLQAARQIFDAIGRDLAGVTRDGFLFIRTQELKIDSDDSYSGLLLYYDQDRNGRRLNKGRLDVMVLSTAGYHTSAVDADKTANFARVIWAQSERVNGNNLRTARDTPKFWGINQVLVRHQTLMLPDEASCDASNGDYASGGGRNRGPDCYNMALSDLTRFFGPAMGHGSETNLPTLIDSFGMFSTFYGDGSQELTPFRLSSKVWRFGRSGRGPDGEAPGTEGAGDLEPHQVDIEQTVPRRFLTESYAPQIQRRHVRHECTRGHERPKVFGPKDYHRIAAFGVASFQVDWSDGRRVAVKDSDGDYVGTRLQLYPESRLGNYSRLYIELMGPGEKRTYCWNKQSPASIRRTGIKRAFGGVNYSMRYYDWYSSKPGNWADISWLTQNIFGGGTSMGGGGLGDGGWPWPRAIRIRLLMVDSGEDPPVAYQFEQVYHVLTQ
jgi:type II secretory pathway pseudopilin PulG